MCDPRFVRAVLVLPDSDLKTSRAWYLHALGFETVYLNADPIEDPDGNYAILRRDTAEVHLILDEEPREHPWQQAGTGYLFLIVQNVDAVLEHIMTSNVAVTREIRQESWGARAFQLTDPSGDRILIAAEA